MTKNFCAISNLRRAGNWLKIHKGRLAVHGAIVCVFVLYCVLGAAWVTDRLEGIPGESELRRIDLPDVAAEVCYHVDKLGCRQHAVEITGWAFIKGRDSVKAKIYVLLESDKGAYIFDTRTVMRPDVTTALGGGTLNLDEAGFTSIIPMRKVKCGEYIVGLYVKKDSIQGLCYTDRLIGKRKGDVSVGERLSRLVNLSLPPESDVVACHIDRVQKSGDGTLLTVCGWAFIKGMDTNGSRVYLVLTSEQGTYMFDTVVQERPDVTRAMGGQVLNLESSGFVARIPTESIPAGRYLLGVYVSKGDAEGLFYTGKECEL